jgi:hypothetical protein
MPVSIRKKTAKPKSIIGTTDKIDFPLFEMEDIGCKIDTGARTSSLHCHKVHLVEKDGQRYVSFHLLDPKHKSYQKKEFRAYNFKEKKVKSSFGESEFRFSIFTVIRLFDKEFKAEFTLADRGKMRFPVLLGQRFLQGKFLVDVSLQNISFNQKTAKQDLLT